MSDSFLNVASLDALFDIPALQRLEIENCDNLPRNAVQRTAEFPNMTVLHDLAVPDRWDD